MQTSVTGNHRQGVAVVGNQLSKLAHLRKVAVATTSNRNSNVKPEDQEVTRHCLDVAVRQDKLKQIMANSM
jgi:hypothetical protein